jgi:1-acyl-sn-glycerol-3-phosphate acyltransferase
VKVVFSGKTMSSDKRSSLTKALILLNMLSGTVAAMLKMLFLKYLKKADVSTLNKAGQKWAGETLRKLGYKIQTSGNKAMNTAGVFAGNHVSFLDIPLLWSQGEITFVSKAEVARWPVIGAGAKMVGTILVKRDSYKSRKSVMEQMAQEVISKNKRVAIFPEGTSTVTGKNWKWGAFALAEKNSFPIQLFCLSYAPLRESAYIDDDKLFAQIWRLLDFPEKTVYLHFGEVIHVNDQKADCINAQAWCQEKFRLINQQNYSEVPLS